MRDNTWWLEFEWIEGGSADLPDQFWRAIELLDESAIGVARAELAVRIEAAEQGSMVWLSADQVRLLAHLRSTLVVHATLSRVPPGFRRARRASSGGVGGRPLS